MNERATSPRRDGEEPLAPPRLVAALREPPARRVFVPPTVDEAVLNAARRHLAARPRARFRAFRSWRAWPAVATAGLALAAMVYVSSKPTRPPPGFAREDLNRDGRVDILDAFQLARELQSGAKTGAGLDLNGDGVVDQRDAEAIAVQAVKLEKGGRS